MLLAQKSDSITANEGLPQSEVRRTAAHLCLEFVRRQLWVMLSCLLLAAFAGGFYLLITRPTFTASATMLLDARRGGVQQKSVLGDTPNSDSWIDSQIGILVLEREKIGLSVAKKLELAKNPAAIEPVTGLGSALIAAISSIFQRGNTDKNTTEMSEAELTQAAAGVVAGGLEVKRIGVSYLISINFSSYNQELALRIANAAADAYVVAELDAKYQSLRQASDWLQERYQTLREQASTADRAVVEFKGTHNIVTAGGRLVNDQQLSEINDRLGAARAKTADHQAKLDQIKAVLKEQESNGTIDSTVPDALLNPIITRLRSQYLDIINREADWSKRFGNNHQAVVNLRNQAREIRNSTHEELRRIGESYKSELEIAKKNEAELEKQLAAILAEIPNEAQIILRGLESSAQSYRKFYENFLLNYTESVQQQSSPIPETRVISHASWAFQSHPSTSRVMLLTILGGMALGIGLGVLREALDRSFRTSGQVQAVLQTDCLALIPLLKHDHQGGILGARHLGSTPGKQRMIGTAESGLRLVTDAPFSRFADSIRALKLAADLRGEKNVAKAIGLTSSIPREGKSTIAAALASLAAQVGERVILVDCDLRNPALSQSLAPHANAGLLEVLSGHQSLEQVIWKDSTTDLSFLPAGNVSQTPNTAQILTSDAMKRLFDVLRMRYDYIVADLSPLAPIVDVRATTGLVDFYVFLIEWGHTKIDVVQQALKDAHGIYDNLLGVVLNKVDMNVVARYEGSRAKYYRNKFFSRYGYRE